MAKDAPGSTIFLRGVGPDATNEELIDRAADGSSLAWGLIIERYERLVWSVIRSYGIRRADGQDLFQLSFLLLHSNLRSIREPDKLGLWLHTTTRRECVRHLKRIRRSTTTDQPIDEIDVADRRQSPEDVVAAAEENARLRTLFEQLSPACRKLLILSLDDPPASYDEMARSLNVKRGTVGSKRRRCLDRLGAIYRTREAND